MYTEKLEDSQTMALDISPELGAGLKVQKWDVAFAEFISELDKKKPVVITGDLNCAHQSIDIHSPRTNKKSPGFTEASRLLSNACWIP